jgi:hypothetical protein
MKGGDGDNGSVELHGALIVSFNFTQTSTEPIKFSRLGGSQGMGEALDKKTWRIRTFLFSFGFKISIIV